MRHPVTNIPTFAMGLSIPDEGVHAKFHKVRALFSGRQMLKKVNTTWSNGLTFEGLKIREAWGSPIPEK